MVLGKIDKHYTTNIIKWIVNFTKICYVLLNWWTNHLSWWQKCDSVNIKKLKGRQTSESVGIMKGDALDQRLFRQIKLKEKRIIVDNQVIKTNTHSFFTKKWMRLYFTSLESKSFVFIYTRISFFNQVNTAPVEKRIVKYFSSK